MNTLQTPQTQPATKINFRIDRLTLGNYSLADQVRFTRALERRLRDYASLALAQDWSTVTSIGRLDTGTLPPGSTPEQTARHIARRIFLKLRPDVPATLLALSGAKKTKHLPSFEGRNKENIHA